MIKRHLLSLLFLLAGVAVASAAAPIITSQPQTKVSPVGGNVTFSVSVDSTLSVTYQWRKKAFTGTSWTDIAGAVDRQFSLQNVQLSDDHFLYSVTVANADGAVISANAGLFVGVPPTIVSQSPTHVKMRGASLVALNVVATGSGILSYTWQKNGVTVIGAQSFSYFLGVEPPSADQYSCRVSNPYGSVTSAPCVVECVYSDAPEAWGQNNSGQSVPPLNLTEVKAFAAGWDYNLALTADGTIAGWGNNSHGQATPPPVNDVIDLTAGYRHSIALRRNGGLVGWGDNSFGQLNFPANVGRTIAVKAGRNHTLVLAKDGTVAACGDDSYGQATVPAGLGGVIAIAAGADHGLALKNDGTVTAWGRNDAGQCNVPSNLNNVVAIAAGTSHSLALKSDGTVVGWGANTQGQISVPSGNAFCKIACGEEHSVALRSDGTVAAWGANDFGQTTLPSGLPHGISIAAGARHSVVIPNNISVDYRVNPSTDVLLIYNSQSADSLELLNYYRAHRPGIEGANVLAISCPTTPICYAGEREAIYEADYETQIAQPVQSWLAANPTKRPRYVVLFLDVPARRFNPDCTAVPGGVQAHLRILMESATGFMPQVTHLNMADLAGCKAYVDKLVAISASSTAELPTLKVESGDYGNGKFYFDAVQTGEGPGELFPFAAWARLGVLAAGIDPAAVTYAAPADPHISSAGNVSGFLTYGTHGGLPADYPINGQISFSGASGWYLIETVESFNGMRVDMAQGNFIRFFSPNAFGGTNYQNTPIGAVTHVEEPFIEGVNDSLLYFGLWAKGRTFATCAWASAKTGYMQAIGDPFAAAHFQPDTIEPRLATTDRDPSDGFVISVSGAVGSGWQLERSSDLQNWSMVGTVATALPGDGSITDNATSSQSKMFYRLRKGTSHSENAVGFIRLTLKSGYTLIANQLNNGRNKLDDVLPSAPDGTTLFKLSDGSTWSSHSDSYFEGYGWYGSEGEPVEVLRPGEGAMVYNPSSDYETTLIGEVPQGDVTVSLPQNSSLRSSVVPQALSVDATGFQAVDGDTIYFWNKTSQQYEEPTSYFDDYGWYPFDPVPEVGESFLLQKQTKTSWPRQFSIW
jgi:hypothetical protein